MDLRSVIDRLRAHRDELAALGVARLSVFGSVARAEAAGDSDVDLAVVLDPEAGYDLVRFDALERRLASILGARAHLVSEPVRLNPSLQAEIDRDRAVAL